jgi:chemotaxis protein methyltransferase CheR
MSTVRTIGTQDYDAFRKFLQDACGILLGDNKQYLVSSRLNKIMAQHGMTTLGELTQSITSHPRSGLKEAVVDAMTTNETLWFRDIHPYNILQNQLLPELSKSLGGQQLKIWSAACSTGQEPYSISMVMDEFKQKNPGSFRSGERIVATDISSTVLNAAKSGEYEMLALGRGLSQDRLTKFFQQTGDGRWAVKAPIKQRVDFKPMNLLHSYSMLGKFDKEI